MATRLSPQPVLDGVLARSDYGVPGFACHRVVSRATKTLRLRHVAYYLKTALRCVL
jgi:hypothetical protein